MCFLLYGDNKNGAICWMTPFLNQNLKRFDRITERSALR